MTLSHQLVSTIAVDQSGIHGNKQIIKYKGSGKDDELHLWTQAHMASQERDNCKL